MTALLLLLGIGLGSTVRLRVRHRLGRGRLARRITHQLIQQAAGRAPSGYSPLLGGSGRGALGARRRQ